MIPVFSAPFYQVGHQLPKPAGFISISQKLDVVYRSCYQVVTLPKSLSRLRVRFWITLSLQYAEKYSNIARLSVSHTG